MSSSFQSPPDDRPPASAGESTLGDAERLGATLYEASTLAATVQARRQVRRVVQAEAAAVRNDQLADAATDALDRIRQWLPVLAQLQLAEANGPAVRGWNLPATTDAQGRPVPGGRVAYTPKTQELRWYPASTASSEVEGGAAVLSAVLLAVLGFVIGGRAAVHLGTSVGGGAFIQSTLGLLVGVACALLGAVIGTLGGPALYGAARRRPGRPVEQLPPAHRDLVAAHVARHAEESLASLRVEVQG